MLIHPKFLTFKKDCMRYLIVILTSLPLFLFSQGSLNLPTFVDTAIFRSQPLEQPNGEAGLIQIHDHQLNVLVFLSPECPLSINYTKPLNELAADYPGKVNFIGIVPGRSYDASVVEQFVKEYGLRFQVYIDKEKRITKTARATITPEVVAFNARGEILYRGAIDDWAIAPGKKKQNASKRYLNNAIQAFITGSEIPVKTTRAVGCLINDY